MQKIAWVVTNDSIVIILVKMALEIDSCGKTCLTVLDLNLLESIWHSLFNCKDNYEEGFF